MSEIPQWADDRALELAKIDGVGRGVSKTDGLYYCDMRSAFARYIAAHEEAPEDPLVAEAEQVLEVWFSTGGGQFACRNLVLNGIKRGMELAKSHV